VKGEATMGLFGKDGLIRGGSWRHHPAVRSGDQLTRGERSADLLRNAMGSWAFVIVSLVFLGGWMIGNRNVGFDPYPFILLNLVLSCLAAMQGAILLIAAKREDSISSALAMHDFETNQRAERVIRIDHHLLCVMANKLDVDVDSIIKQVETEMATEEAKVS
jgi:uncharacterized membrane protein